MATSLVKPAGAREATAPKQQSPKVLMDKPPQHAGTPTGTKASPTPVEFPGGGDSVTISPALDKKHSPKAMDSRDWEREFERQAKERREQSYRENQERFERDKQRRYEERKQEAYEAEKRR